MKKYSQIITTVLLMMLAGCTVPAPIHYHTGFQIYVDNKLQDFSDLKYMHVKPCMLHEETAPLTADEIQNEKAHLHDRNGDVVHTHQAGAIWGDLFTNINYQFKPEMPLKAYVNGELYNDDIFKKPIIAYESVVIFAGTNDEIPKKLAGAVTKTRLLEVEGKSEDCGVKKQQTK